MKYPKKIVDASTRATVLKRKFAILTAEFDECKALIRPWALEVYEEALKTDPDAKNVEVPTSEGTLTVSFPKATPAVIDGQNLYSILERLPKDKSALVVVQELSIAKTFGECWNSVVPPFTPAEREIIKEVVMWKPSTPRVEPAKS